MKRNSKTLRTITALAIVAIVFVGFLTNLGIGTISAPGIWDISILCTLGALGTMLASKMMVPRAVVSLVIMVALIIVFARAFCGWICPVPVLGKLRAFFRSPKKRRELEQAKRDEALDIAKFELGCGGKGGCESCSACKQQRTKLDSRHYVLGGALLSTAIFGFPVFCWCAPSA